MHGEYLTLKPKNSTEMRAYVARPTDSGNGCGIIVLQEAFGVNGHIREIAERFASEGYLAVAPELYHRTGSGVEIAYHDFGAAEPHRETLTDELLGADLAATFMWLGAQKEIAESRIASVGFCMGGRISFLANELLPLKAAVSFYGGGIGTLLEKAGELHGPMLMCWGGQDKHIPHEEKRAIVDTLDALGKKYVSVEFSDAGHGFFCNERESYNEAAAKEAWPLTLAFLRARIFPPSSHGA